MRNEVTCLFIGLAIGAAIFSNKGRACLLDPAPIRSDINALIEKVSAYQCDKKVTFEVNQNTIKVDQSAMTGFPFWPFSTEFRIDHCSFIHGNFDTSDMERIVKDNCACITRQQENEKHEGR